MLSLPYILDCLSFFIYIYFFFKFVNVALVVIALNGSVVIVLAAVVLSIYII